MTKVAEIMDRTPVVVLPSASVKDVARKMRRSGADVAFVCAHGKLRGTITNRNMVNAMGFSGQKSKMQEAISVMSANGPRISAGVEIMEAAKLMAHHRVSHLPVVQNGRFLGVLTLKNLAGESLTLASMVLDCLLRDSQTQEHSPMFVWPVHTGATKRCA